MTPPEPNKRPFGLLFFKMLVSTLAVGEANRYFDV